MAWQWPETYNRDGAVELARFRGCRMAHRWALNRWDAEDLIQEAQTALLAEWPRLVARYALPSGRVEGGLICVAVDADVVDYIRRERGTRRIDKPPPNMPLEAIPLQAEDDTEADAIRHADRVPLDEMIERLIVRCKASDHTKKLLRYTCRRLADGAEVTAIAKELGYTRSHISALLTRFRQQVGRAL